MRHFKILVEPVIYPIKDFFPKAFTDVGCDLRRKGITTSKSSILNSFHAVWNVDACKGVTESKSVIPNICYAVWNDDACKGVTERKSTFPNACYTVRNGVVRFFSSIRYNCCLIFVK